MQVILSAKEYNDLIAKNDTHKDITKQIEGCFEVTYNDDGDIVKNIRPTVKELNINIDKVIELGNSEVRRAAKEVGTARYMSKQKFERLKTVDRISRMIDEGKIKTIFVFDGWQTYFLRKIEELFGDRVNVCTIRNSIRSVEGMRFNNSDCILFYETILNDHGEAKACVLRQAKINEAFTKVLTEDIFM